MSLTAHDLQMKQFLLFAAIFVTAGLNSLLAQDLPLELPGRVPAPVMSYRGADWLERPERLEEELPDQMLRVLGLEDGDVVADMGAGSGFHTRRIARLVAPTGTVYAVDIQPEMLEILERNVADEGLTGVVPLLGEADDPGLPAGQVDWILLVDVYHELSNYEIMLAKMREALSTEGRIALVEYRVEDGSGDHILAAHRMSVRQVLREWGPAGFDLVELHEFLPSQHLFVFAASDRGERQIAEYDLLEAIQGGHVRVTTTGLGSSTVSLSIERTRAEPMVITLPVGTYFETGGGSSDMIARRDGSTFLTEDGLQDWVVLARRAHQTRAIPGPDDSFEIISAEEHWAERNVMWLFQGLDVHPVILPILEQLGVWIVAEDAGYDDLMEHASTVPVPVADVMGLAVAYVAQAGIDVTRTRAWADRDRYLSALADEGLRTFLEGLSEN